MDDGERQGFIAQPAGLEFRAPEPVNFTCKTVLAHRLEVRRDRFRDLMDVVTELRPQLRDDPGNERGHLVEIGIIRGVAVDAIEPDALEELVHPRPHGAVVDEADVRKHMREAGFARIPVRRHCAVIEGFVQNFTMAHSCPRRG
ncbi:hypothetical protein LOM8899_04601 [Flavimaricola marinus]|uniref:Uncharacterized protein n=1 Tax=Flavimaricola marinus TaxID=1819565 RepID=A0A238LL90_9RHOB|nr:hypothetical protein LOM8899_04601 [Flavimaricola marinus]